MDKKNIKKVVLAYSGGLDTSIIIPWLKENYNNCEVVAVAGNVGQSDELDGLEEKALKTGASKLYVLDLTDDYVDNYIIPCVKAGALYEEYLLGTSHARPCIAKALVDIAIQEKESLIRQIIFFEKARLEEVKANKELMTLRKKLVELEKGNIELVKRVKENFFKELSNIKKAKKIINTYEPITNIVVSTFEMTDV